MTTDPAPMIAPRPILTYGRIVTLTPICAPASMIGPAIDSPDTTFPGYRSLAIVTPGARKTSSSSSVYCAT